MNPDSPGISHFHRRFGKAGPGFAAMQRQS
jgi:hypothetical protein